MTKGPLNLDFRNPFGNTMGLLGKSVEILQASLDEFKDEFRFTKNLSYEASLKYLSFNDGLNKRELHRFLNTADSTGRFGNLTSSLFGDQTPWLCEEHVRYYHKRI